MQLSRSNSLCPRTLFLCRPPLLEELAPAIYSNCSLIELLGCSWIRALLNLNSICLKRLLDPLSAGPKIRSEHLYFQSGDGGVRVAFAIKIELKHDPPLHGSNYGGFWQWCQAFCDDFANSLLSPVVELV